MKQKSSTTPPQHIVRYNTNYPYSTKNCNRISSISAFKHQSERQRIQYDTGKPVYSLVLSAHCRFERRAQYFHCAAQADTQTICHEGAQAI